MLNEDPVLAALLHRLATPDVAVIDLSLDRIRRYLAHRGEPQWLLPPVVHIAGTNGKGSTLAFIRALLEGAGKRCHAFTSPHLVHFRERIVVAGEPISDAALIPLLERIIADQAAYPLTFFEANMAAAVMAFTAAPADYTLLEVGMGGRFDATNVVEKPALCVITPIAMDHAEYLGDSIAKIAYEKAGILKPGVTAVVAPQEAEAMAVIERVAADIGAPLLPVWAEDIAALRQRVNGLALPGAHQWVNAATAWKAVQRLLPHPDLQHLAGVRWPARLQRLRSGPLCDRLPPSAALWLDGGHNPQAGAALADWLAHQPPPRAVICGMTKHKDAAGFLEPLARVAEQMLAVEIPGEAMAMRRDDLISGGRGAGIAIEAADSLEQAVQRASGAQTVLICGSLYLAGQVLAHHG